MRRFTPFVTSMLLICVARLPAQLVVDAVAGGKIPSGIPAQNVPISASGSTLTLDSEGNVVFAESSRNVIRRIRKDGNIETIAGTGFSGFAGDGGLATTATLFAPAFPRYDADGNLYFADVSNQRIRRVDTKGIITTVAGTGIIGNAGRGGPAVSAQFGQISGLAIDKAGNLLVADQNACQILRVTKSGQLEVVAGAGNPDFPNGVFLTDGDNGPAAAAHLASPTALALDGPGNLYIAEISGRFIRKISPDGIINRFAGYGPSTTNFGGNGPAIDASFNTITALTADANANLYVTDTVSRLAVIRKIDSRGIVARIAGATTGGSSGDGPQATRTLGFAQGLWADSSGNVFFGDQSRIRKLTADGSVVTIAGGTPQSSPDGTSAKQAWFGNPVVVAADKNGNLFVAEQASCTVRKIAGDGTISTFAGTGTCASVAPSSGIAKSTAITPPRDLAVDSLGRVYIADTAGTPNIYAISADGSLSLLGGLGRLFSRPYIAVDSKDRLYIGSDTQLIRTTPEGSVEDLTKWLAVNSTILGLTIDAADSLHLLVPNTFNYCTIVNVDRNGVRSGGDVIDFLPCPATMKNIAVDGRGEIWFANGTNLSRPRDFATRRGGYSGDGGALRSARFNSPTSLASGPNGEIYVLDSANNAIRKISGAPPTAAPSINPGGIVNVASYAGGGVAPGEFVAIFGKNLGPDPYVLTPLENNLTPPVLSNVRVLFVGKNPALTWEGAISLISSTQINVFVPYEVAGQTSVDVVIDIDGVKSQPLTISVGTSSFGISSADGSGSGQGAILNQDGSYNDAAHPAPRGSVITLFGTGEGTTSPAPPNGALILSTPLPAPAASVKVTVGGEPAEILYAGAAPTLTAGVAQLNIRIPNGVPPGTARVSVVVGDIVPAQNITVAVQ